MIERLDIQHLVAEAVVRVCVLECSVEASDACWHQVIPHVERRAQARLLFDIEVDCLVRAGGAEALRDDFASWDGVEAVEQLVALMPRVLDDLVCNGDLDAVGAFRHRRESTA